MSVCCGAEKQTPYSLGASEALDMIYNGGKSDDITVVVARLCAPCPSAPTPPIWYRNLHTAVLLPIAVRGVPFDIYPEWRQPAATDSFPKPQQ